MEIERKFLIDINLAKEIGVISEKGSIIEQGYIERTESLIWRIRKQVDNGKVQYILTVKSRNPGLSREEVELKVSNQVGSELFKILLEKPVVKKRFLYNYENLLWEIDIFEGDNEGLFIAEVELLSEEQEVVLPPFIIKEVTHDKRYYNDDLAQHPYSLWEK